LDYLQEINRDQLIAAEKNVALEQRHHLSCTHILNGLAYLGEKYAVLGHADSHNKSLFYLKSFQDGALLNNLTKLSSSSSEALCLIHTEKQKNVSLDPSLFEGVGLFHCNALQLADNEVTKKALDLAKASKVKVSFDLCSEDLVKQHKEVILNLLPKYIDILFANEKEIKELTQLPPQEACDFLSSLCDIVVITLGYSGSWVKSGSLKFYTPSLKTNEILNAGVGDLFITGFLHGYLHKASLPQCSWMGSFVASKALEKGLKQFDYLFWKEVSAQLHRETESLLKSP
jgi:hypothetical protein